MSMAHLAEAAPASAMADPMLPRFARVSRVRRDGADIWTIDIETADGFEFLPGQFNMLYAHGVGEAAISISGAVPTLIPHATFDPNKTVAMVCGPEVMMRFAIADLGKAGVPDSAIYLSMERNMKCAVGLCGHCQFSGSFVCKDGPVYSYDQ